MSPRAESEARELHPLLLYLQSVLPPERTQEVAGGLIVYYEPAERAP